jgi:hypothetical protein
MEQLTALGELAKSWPSSQQLVASHDGRVGAQRVQLSRAPDSRHDARHDARCGLPLVTLLWRTQGYGLVTMNRSI